MLCHECDPNLLNNHFAFISTFYVCAKKLAKLWEIYIKLIVAWWIWPHVAQPMACVCAYNDGYYCAQAEEEEGEVLKWELTVRECFESHLAESLTKFFGFYYN